MFELTIFYADKSIYWTEHFNSLAEAMEWLDNEKTRPYWKKEFTHQIIQHVPPPLSDEAKAAEKDRLDKIDAFKVRIGALSKQDALSSDDIKEALLKLMKLKSLQGEF